MQKILFLTLLLLTTNVAFSEWSISSFFINKMPLEEEVRKDIERMLSIQIKSSTTGLQCYKTATNKQQALSCAKKMDQLLQTLEIEGEKVEKITIMQDSIKKMAWNDEQKQQLIKDIKSAIKTNQESLICISKATTIGALNQCFKKESN